MSHPQLSAVILTKNESRQIAECIDTLTWADDIVIFDSFSDDGTPELARAKGARVMQNAFVHYAQQRNAALERVHAEWIFFVDADERVPPELAAEVQEVVHGRPEVGWWVPRHNYIVGRCIRYAGWYPDYQLRLMRRDRARYDPVREVHEVVLLDGPAGYLKHALIHYNYDSWAEFIEKQRYYAKFDARVLAQQGIHPHPWTYMLQPVREFIRRYLTLQGYREGWHGLFLSMLMAYAAYLTTVELGRLQRPTSPGAS